MRESTCSSFEELAQTNFDLLMDLKLLDNVHQEDENYSDRSRKTSNSSKVNSRSSKKISIPNNIQSSFNYALVNESKDDDKYLNNHAETGWEVEQTGIDDIQLNQEVKQSKSRFSDFKTADLPQLPRAFQQNSGNISELKADPSDSLPKEYQKHSVSKPKDVSLFEFLKEPIQAQVDRPVLVNHAFESDFNAEPVTKSNYFSRTSVRGEAKIRQSQSTNNGARASNLRMMLKEYISTPLENEDTADIKKDGLVGELMHEAQLDNLLNNVTESKHVNIVAPEIDQGNLIQTDRSTKEDSPSKISSSNVEQNDLKEPTPIQKTEVFSLTTEELKKNSNQSMLASRTHSISKEFEKEVAQTIENSNALPKEIAPSHIILTADRPELQNQSLNDRKKSRGGSLRIILSNQNEGKNIKEKEGDTFVKNTDSADDTSNELDTDYVVALGNFAKDVELDSGRETFFEFDYIKLSKELKKDKTSNNEKIHSKSDSKWINQVFDAVDEALQIKAEDELILDKINTKSPALNGGPSIVGISSSNKGSPPSSNAIGVWQTEFINIEGKKVLKSATLYGLLKHLFDPDNINLGLLYAFLLHHKFLLSSQDLLDVILGLWKQKSKSNKSSDLQVFQIVNILNFWIDNFPSDIKNDQNSVKKLSEFIYVNQIATRKTHMIFSTLTNRLEQKILVGPTRIENPFLESAPRAIHPHPAYKNSKPQIFRILEFDAAELARQICLLDFEFFKNTSPREFLCSKKPIITQWCENLKWWIVSEILNVKDTKLRASTVDHILDTARVIYIFINI